MIWDKAYLRTEKFLTPNQPIREALEDIRIRVDLDKVFLTPVVVALKHVVVLVVVRLTFCNYMIIVAEQ